MFGSHGYQFQWFSVPMVISSPDYQFWLSVSWLSVSMVINSFAYQLLWLSVTLNIPSPAWLPVLLDITVRYLRRSGRSVLRRSGVDNMSACLLGRCSVRAVFTPGGCNEDRCIHYQRKSCNLKRKPGLKSKLVSTESVY